MMNGHAKIIGKGTYSFAPTILEKLMEEYVLSDHPVFNSEVRDDGFRSILIQVSPIAATKGDPGNSLRSDQTLQAAALSLKTIYRKELA